MDAQRETPPPPAAEPVGESEVERLIATLPTSDRNMKADILRAVAREFRRVRPRVALEFGSGTSTAVLALLCALHGGRLVSIEESERFLRRTEDLLATLDLLDVVTLVRAPIRRVRVRSWRGRSYRLPDGALDRAMDGEKASFLLVDGPASAWRLRRDCRYATVPLVGPWLAEAATVLLDDAERRREKAIMARWEREGLVRLLRTVDGETGLAIGEVPAAIKTR